MELYAGSEGRANASFVVTLSHRGWGEGVSDGKQLVLKASITKNVIVSWQVSLGINTIPRNALKICKICYKKCCPACFGDATLLQGDHNTKVFIQA